MMNTLTSNLDSLVAFFAAASNDGLPKVGYSAIAGQLPSRVGLSHNGPSSFDIAGLSS